MQEQEYRTDAPAAPDARVLALDIGLYGHRGSITSMFWYQHGGMLHSHVASLLDSDFTLVDQLDTLEAWAETYPEYYRVSPVVIVGTTVLSPFGKNQVRRQLDSWYNPPHRRRLAAIGDYAGEQAASKGVVPRKKVRDLLADRISAHALTLTRSQFDAVGLYTGRREKPGHDPDTDGWRHDDTDAIALPVALACFAARFLLPAPTPTEADKDRALDRAVRAWQLETGLSTEQATEQAQRVGHPNAQHSERTGSWLSPTV